MAHWIIRALVPSLLLLPFGALAQEPILFGVPNQGAVTAEQTYNGTAGPVAMSMTLFAHIFAAINDPMQNSVNGVVQAMVGYVQGQLRPLALLAVVLAILTMMVAPGASGAQVGPQLMRIGAKISALAAIFATAANFSDWIIAPFLAFPQQVTAAVLGATGQAALQGGAPFDLAFVHVMKADFNAMTNVGFFSIEGLCAGFVIGLSAIFSGLCIGVMFAMWMVGYVLFYLVMAISPLFVATLLFTFSKHFFAGWLSAAVSSSLVLILIGVILSLMLRVQQQLVDTVMNAPANADKWGMVGSAIGMCVLTALGAMAAWKVDQKAVGLAGGVYQGTVQHVGAIGGAIGNAGSWASNWISSHGGGGGGAIPAPAFAGAGSGGTGAASPVGRALGGGGGGFGARP